MKQLLALVLVLNIVGISHVSSAAHQEKEATVRGSHVHLGVKDLPAALQWLDRVWQLRPTFQDDRLASLPFGALTVILEASDVDTTATLGFESQNCDEDFRTVRSRGGVALEEPKDRPWGVRSAYIQGARGTEVRDRADEPAPAEGTHVCRPRLTNTKKPYLLCVRNRFVAAAPPGH